MSALGQKQTFAVHQPMSALHLKADMCSARAHVYFGPTADIRSSKLGQQPGPAYYKGNPRKPRDKPTQRQDLLD